MADEERRGRDYIIFLSEGFREGLVVGVVGKGHIDLRILGAVGFMLYVNVFFVCTICSAEGLEYSWRVSGRVVPSSGRG